MIEKCAESGTWVLVSTLRFPSFWEAVVDKLEQMRDEGRIMNTFRLFFDIQGYKACEVPRSFLFSHSAVFYLTEKNNEDMEGFNDVWANILADNIMDKSYLNKISILEPPSSYTATDLHLNLESNIVIESSMESMLPDRHSKLGNGSKASKNRKKYKFISDVNNPDAPEEVKGGDLTRSIQGPRV